MNQSTLDSIRRLAERPGTEHEGIVAREMLKKLEHKVPPAVFTPEISYFLRRYGIPETVTCPCGKERNIYAGPCDNYKAHSEIYLKVRATFSRGDRVFYNYWAYPPNCPGKIAAHIPLQKENGTFPWSWVSVRFDHLKSARRIPILNDDGEWCLTKEPK